jgi:cob(I)alamin adenosyltransferase
MQPKKWPGDAGKTRMLGVHEMDKDSLSVEAIGAIDELNSFVGLTITKTGDGEVEDILKDVQKDLLTIGAEIAGAGKREDKSTQLEPDHVVRLENVIFSLEQQLEPLKSFILPGGSEDSAHLHVARSVCRRAERRVVSLKREKIINDDIIKYLNRLSFLFFLLARKVNEKKGISEHKW